MDKSLALKYFNEIYSDLDAVTSDFFFEVIHKIDGIIVLLCTVATRTVDKRLVILVNAISHLWKQLLPHPAVW